MVLCIYRDNVKKQHLRRYCPSFLSVNVRFYDCAGDSSRDLPWGALDDVVMGGVSESTFRIDPTGGENGKPTGLFTGLIFSDTWKLHLCSFI